MLTTLRSLRNSLVGMPAAARAIMAVVAAFAGIAGLAVSVFLSPLFAVVFLIAFLVCAAAFVIRLLRRRPVLRWVLAGGACFVLMFAFSGVSAALYGGGEETAAPIRETEERQPEPREETTRPAETTAEETTRPPERTREETTRRPEPPPAPQPAQPPPEPNVEWYDATVTVTRVVDGDTVEISPAVEGVSEVRLIGVDTPETKDPSEEVEPFGPEASEFATARLQGQQ